MGQPLRRFAFSIGLLLMTGGTIYAYSLWPAVEPAGLGAMLLGVILVWVTRKQGRRAGAADSLHDLGGYPMSMLRSNRFITRR